MTYLLVDRVDGSQQKLTIDPTEPLAFSVNQGDEVQVVDRAGRYACGKAVAEGSDLRLVLVDQSEVRLVQFYNSPPNAAPITVALDLLGDSEWDDDDDVEIQIEEVREENRIKAFDRGFEQISFSYEAFDGTTKEVTVEVNGSHNCPLRIADDE